MSIYLNNPWKPVFYSIIKDKSLINTVESKGFSIETAISQEIIQKLRNLFKENHKIESDKGGMFYSIYSQDTMYRRKIHDAIGEILIPVLESYFENYKMVLNFFVVKVSGPKSEFSLHQDTTGLDEWQHSPLSLWIPLQDVDENNGCLGLIPYSQHLTPYRSISFPTPFDNIQNKVKQYLQPARMKEGDVLIFDNRLLHHSYFNQSGKTRIAVVCGLFPKDAKMITCHKPVYECGGKVELIEHEDDYLLKGKNFLIDCQKRPETGRSLGWVEDPYTEMSIEDFEALCAKYGVEKATDKVFEDTACELIEEPVFTSVQEIKKDNFWSRIKGLVLSE